MDAKTYSQLKVKRSQAIDAGDSQMAAKIDRRIQADPPSLETVYSSIGDVQIAQASAPSSVDEISRQQLVSLKEIIDSTAQEPIEAIRKVSMEGEAIVVVARVGESLIRYMIADDTISSEAFEEETPKQDSEIIVPVPIRRLFREGITLNRKRRSRKADINAVRRAKAIARGVTPTAIEIIDMRRWLEENKRFERSQIGSEEHTAWMLYGGTEALKWMNGLRLDSVHEDDATRSKRIIPFHDFQIGLQYQPWDWRHGKRLPVGYGHLRLTRNPDDGTCLDVYVGPHLESTKVWAVKQFVDGKFDEMKYFIGFDHDSTADEIKMLYSRIMAPEMFGGVKQSSLAELKQFIRDQKC